MISIIGPFGTGKSTFLRCLNKIEEPTRGEIIAFGENVCDPKCDLLKVRTKMGMVFQSFNLFSNMNILDNITCGPMMLLKESREEAENHARELLVKVGLSGRENDWPDQLSGGQKQRVAIARTLAMHPEIILFDEPTSALDPRMVGEVLSVIRSLAGQGITMLIVTHEMRFAEHVSTRVLYLDRGIIYEDGTPEQIFHQPQGELTRDFIRNLQVFKRTIDPTHGYDYRELEGSLISFAKDHFVGRVALNSIQHVTEELLLEVLKEYRHMTGACIFTFRCTEDGTDPEIGLEYPDESYDLLEEARPLEPLSQQIIEAYVSVKEHSYRDGRNRLILKIKE